MAFPCDRFYYNQFYDSFIKKTQFGYEAIAGSFLNFYLHFKVDLLYKKVRPNSLC